MSTRTQKVLPEATLTGLEDFIRGSGQALIPEKIAAELVRGYRRYVQITASAPARLPHQEDT